MKADKMVIIFNILLFLFIPFISQETDSIMVSTILTESIELFTQSKIKIKVNKEGSLNLIYNTNIPSPDEIRIGDEIKGTNVYTVTVDDIESEIELIWNDKLTTTYAMLYSLSYITDIDLSEFDNSEVTNMSYMFGNCISLKSINFGNIDTSNVEDMSVMFYNCYSLTSLDVSNFETSKVTVMNNMFHGCNSLESLDLSKWNTQSNTKFTSTFKDCYNLKYLNLDGIKTDSVFIFNYMFCNCYSLKYLNLSHFKNSENNFGLSAEYMFTNCTSLIFVDISNFASNTDNYILLLIVFMFEGCKNLRYVNFKKLDELSGNNYDNDYILDDTPNNMVICLPKSGASKLKAIFSEKDCGVIDCSDNWEEKQKKINNETGDCMDECKGDFNYEYNTICYRECPKGTKVKDIPYLCEETTIDDEIIISTDIFKTTILTFENEDNIENEINIEESIEKEISKENKEEETNYEIEISIIENMKQEINDEHNFISNIEEKKEKTHVMVYIGIAIAVVVVIAAGLIIYYFFIRKKKQKNNSHHETAEEPPANTNIDRAPETYVNSPINIYNVRNNREINNVSENRPETYSKDISKNIIISK